MTNNKELTSTHFDNQKMGNINNKQQTPVEWQFEQLFNSFEKFNNGEYTFDEYLKRNLEIRAKSKEMENQQRSIELPSDEEIEKESFDLYANHNTYSLNVRQYKAFKRGAKWMRDKIQGGEQ
jgi:hypothetical protein